MKNRPMRRGDRQLTIPEAQAILATGRFGVLAAIDAAGTPYGVPLHYVWDGKALYLHTTADGGELTQALTAHPTVSFTVVETDDGIRCRSALVRGHCAQAPNQKAQVLERLVEKYVPQPHWAQAKAGIPQALDHLEAWRITIEELSGKWVDKPAGR